MFDSLKVTKGKKVGSFFDRNDFFATKIPHFNFEGEQQVGSSIGCLFSVFLTLICSYVAYNKSSKVFYRAKPIIMSIEDINKKTHDDSFSFEEWNFHMAWGVKRGGDYVSIDDANFVEWAIEKHDAEAEHDALAEEL